MDAAWFAGRLKELREAKGLTQNELADAAGLHLGVVRNLERGGSGPTWKTVIALAVALGVGVEEFAKPPAGRQPSGPGRPRKAPPSAPGASEAAGPGEEAPEEEEPPRRKRKGRGRR